MKWLLIAAAVIALISYAAIHASTRGIDEDMQNMLDDEQARIVGEMMRVRKEKQSTNGKR